tara:strand:+ start:244166 stop:245185 length:1020 start_codon:yes stop_codon:yes gene_type:complete
VQPRHDASLLTCNTLGLEASASALAVLEDEEQLAGVLQWAGQRDLSVVPLGEGSNVVFAGDIDALLLRVQTRGRTVTPLPNGSVRLEVKAGENWHRLVTWTLEQGFYGLENLALIPGKVGAAPIQNIGAYGVELCSVVSRVHAVKIDTGEALQFSSEECEFAYRDSVFKHSLRDKTIITQVDFLLSTVADVQASYPALQQALLERQVTNPGPRDVFEAVVAVRRQKLPDPGTTPNAGSFFKNPIVDVAQAARLQQQFSAMPQFDQPDGRRKLAAAWMIEYCGYKGIRRDGVGVHPEHALVMINYHNHSGSKLLELAREIASAVQQTFGVELEIEPRVYG